MNKNKIFAHLINTILSLVSGDLFNIPGCTVSVFIEQLPLLWLSVLICVHLIYLSVHSSIFGRRTVIEFLCVLLYRVNKGMCNCGGLSTCPSTCLNIQNHLMDIFTKSYRIIVTLICYHSGT